MIRTTFRRLMLRQQPRIIANPSQCFIIPVRTPGIVAAKRTFSQTQAVAYNKGGFSLDDYHKVSEGTLEGILESVEAVAEKRTDVDVEYSVCSPSAPPKNLANKLDVLGRGPYYYSAAGNICDQ
jgi:hypothetical protein